MLNIVLLCSVTESSRVFLIETRHWMSISRMRLHLLIVLVFIVPECAAGISNSCIDCIGKVLFYFFNHLSRELMHCHYFLVFS